MTFAFTIQESRVQRKSDGTLQIKGVRFEVPSRFRHFDRLYVRYQSWNLSRAWLVDERDSTLLAGKRRLRRSILRIRSKTVKG